ncbi:MAG: PilZ domain-containing protein [Myxococcota bacterium]
MSNDLRAERHHVELKLVYDDGSSFSTGRVRDVSDTGLFLETAEPLPKGTIIKLFPLNPEAGEIFEIEAEVMRIEADDEDASTLGGMGLHFMHKEDEAPVHLLIEALEKQKDQTVKDPFLGIRVPLTQDQAQGGDA